MNSPGGSVFAASQIVASMRRSVKPISLNIDGICCSAATFILFGFIDLQQTIRPQDVFYIDNDSMFLFHNGFKRLI